MDFQIINPIEYHDWDSLLLRSQNHSLFHTSAWAKVLASSYGYKPIYFASFENGQLALLMPFMHVSSPLTGKRGVSLPFTDCCAPHFLRRELLQEAIKQAIDYGKKAGWKYIEWRDSEYFMEEVPPSEIYYMHDLKLLRTEAELFSILKDNNRRNINKAIREEVSIKIDQSLDSLRAFYQLNCITRRRHGLPPQPFSFFKNVFDHIIFPGYGVVVSAFHADKVVAASIFLHFGKIANYKYGASNMEYQNLRANNLIMWEAIKWYRNRGFATLNFGRTESENNGLLRFKRSWGAKESQLKYYRYNFKKNSFLQNRPEGNPLYKRLFARTPAFILRIIGRFLYKHVG